MNVMMIGGAGGMGKWFARFFKENGVDVQIVDKSDKTEAIAKREKEHVLHNTACSRKGCSQ